MAIYDKEYVNKFILLNEQNEQQPKSNIYHLTETDIDGKTLNPSIPFYLKNKSVQDRIDSGELPKEEYKTPRVCFSNSIHKCLIAMYPLGDDKFNYSKLMNKIIYVNVPEKDLSEYKHYTNKYLIENNLVWDARYTGELWILEPVKLVNIGTIKITKTNMNPKPKEYPYNFVWVEKNK